MQIDFPLSLFYYDSHEHNCLLGHFDSCPAEAEPFPLSEPPLEEYALLEDSNDPQKDSSECDS